MKTINNLILSLTLMLILSSCGDDVPTDYIEEIYVEGFLLVGEPIRNIVVAKTQPVTSEYNFANSLYRDAKVIIKGDGREFPLSIADSGEEGFYYEDQSYLVKENTEYNIQIETKDGKLITGETLTPYDFDWVERVPKPLQYPFDTLKPPTSDPIIWTESEGIDYYLISIKCLDTLEYGKYLENVEDTELNRRIERPWTEDEDFLDHTNWGLIPNTESKIVWGVFKWFGRQETAVYAPDENFRNWFIQNQWFASYDENLSSIEGGIGAFGSAAVIRDTTFLIKNQK